MNLYDYQLEVIAEYEAKVAAGGRQTMELPPAEIVIVDEARASLSLPALIIPAVMSNRESLRRAWVSNSSRCARKTTR